MTKDRILQHFGRKETLALDLLMLQEHEQKRNISYGENRAAIHFTGNRDGDEQWRKPPWHCRELGSQGSRQHCRQASSKKSEESPGNLDKRAGRERDMLEAQLPMR